DVEVERRGCRTVEATPDRVDALSEQLLHEACTIAGGAGSLAIDGHRHRPAPEAVHVSVDVGHAELGQREAEVTDDVDRVRLHAHGLAEMMQALVGRVAL